MKKHLKFFVSAVTLIAACTVSHTFASAREFEPVEFLEGIGVMVGNEQGSSAPESSVTREEMAAISVRLLGREEEAEAYKGECNFEDVPDGHWAEGYISVAKMNGIMTGISEEEFGIGQEITYEQAVKTIVSIMGYSSYAEFEGGYPNGYIKWASDNKILNGVKGAQGQAISREAMAVMIYNVVEEPILKISGLQGNNYTVQKDDNVTILSEYLHIEKKDKGIVTANSRTGLKSAADNTKKGNVEIDGVQYNIGKTKAEEFLGQSVVYYATDGEETDKTIKLITSRYDEEVINVESEDIINIDLDGISYYKDNKSKNKRFAPLLDIIYNEKAYNGFNKNNLDLLKMPYGSIKMIDNDKDGTIDVLYVRNYTNHVVSSVNVREELIAFKDNTPGLKLTDDIILLDDDGMELTIDNVKADCVLSLMRNPDTDEVQAAVLVKNWVKGTIETINAEEKEVKIFGTLYKYADSVEEKMQVGYYGIFYLSGDNVISGADIESLKEGEDYAYLIRVTEDDIPDDGMLLCKLMTLDGRIAKYNITNKTSINGKKLGSNSTIYYVADKLSETRNKTGQMSQPVIVNIDDDKIVSMKTIDDEVSYKGTALYSYQTQAFVNGTKILCYGGPETKLMFVGDDTHYNDDYYYRVGKLTDLISGRRFDGCFGAYGIDYENGTQVADVIVINIDTAALEKIGPSLGRSGIVTEVFTMVDSNDEIVTAVDVLNFDGTVTLTFPIEEPISYSKGDFISFMNINQLGVNKCQHKILKSKEEIDNLDDKIVSSSDVNSAFRYEIGVLHNINGNYITVGNKDNDPEKSNVFYITDAKVIVYDAGNKSDSIVTGNKDLLNGFEYNNSPDARIIVFTNETRVTGVIVYK